MKTLLTRRTIRKYTDQDVSEELLNRLMTEAARTQTMGNLQLYSVIVTRSKEMKEKLAPAHFNQPMVKEAPVVLTICADFNRTSFWAQCRNAVPGYDNFLSYINAATDALLYTQTLCNLMDEEGLGYCYLGTTVYQPQEIIDILQLPKLVMPVPRLLWAGPTKSLPSPTVCPWRVSCIRRPTTTIWARTSTPIINIKRNSKRTATLCASTTRRHSRRSSPISATPAKTTRRCRKPSSPPSSAKASYRIRF